MSVIDVIKERRSVRDFEKIDVKEDIIRKIIECAIHAPSSGNLQNWRFFVIKDIKRKKRIANIAYGQRFIENASFLIVVCSDQNVMNYYGNRGKDLYSKQNTAAAIQNMLLAAWEMGIASCWIGAFSNEEIKKFLNLGRDMEVHAIVAFGYAKSIPKIPKRKNIEEVTFFL